MKSTLLFLILCFVHQQLPFSLALRAPQSLVAKRSSRFDRIFDKVFNDADLNKDGTVNFNEVYELVLQVYIKLNRSAPIPPPSREIVMKIYRKSDKNSDNRLTREEFKSLANTFTGRVLTRLTGYKLVTLVGAPLLAEYMIRNLTGNEWLESLPAMIIPTQYEEKVLPVVTSKAFWRTVLMVLFVATLGNIVLSIVDLILEITLRDDGEEAA